MRAAVAEPTGDAPAAVGSIQGLVQRPDEPRRRVAERYPGVARASAREAPQIPVVVHLEGRLAGPASRDVGPVRVSQRDTTFVPPLVVVPVGTEVAFPNEDPFFHNVFSYSRAKRFDLGRYPQGETKSVLFGAPGYVKVLCEVHQWMRAAILVVENPFHQVVDEDGRFRIDGIPEGRHTLVVSDFERGSREVDVEVTAGGTAQVEVRLGR